MTQLIAYCGLDCGKCPAYLATKNNDRKALEKTAAEWSERFKAEIKPEEIICDGCTSPTDRKNAYCSMCEIRLCCLKKSFKNCASCEEYSCEKLEKFLKGASEAKENLEKLRK